jgi:septal ring factor EnvC (AmiA/AmiB activator)
MALSRLRVILVALPMATTACVESGVHEQTEQKLSESRQALAVKDTEIRAYQWQAANLAQQLHEAQQRSDALHRDLLAQIQQLTTANAALGERLKRLEGERTALILAPPGDPGSPTRDKPGVRPEELRRMIAAADARNALIVEELARIERALTGGAAAPVPSSRPPVHEAAGRDVLDPWGLGSRK